MKESLNGRRVAVVVGGDVGRSPRMQYHALSLLREGADVSIVGYAGEALVPSLEEQRSRVELAQFVPFEWPELKRRCWPLFALVKALALILQLTWTLMRIERPDCILVQNPPSFPVLPCVILAGLLRGVPCVIDFHNLGFSVLALALGPKLGAPGGRVVRACKWVEGWCARRATRSFVVTRAMQEYLRGAFGIHCDVLHDCPPSFFGSVTEATARHDLFSRLAEEFAPATAALARFRDSAPVPAGDTLFTEVLPGGRVAMRDDRPALLISSTSWTEDEDFSLLLDAIAALDQKAADVPFTCVVVTGKGPLKEHYQAKVAALGLKRFCVLTMWLTPSDYPLLLGCADLGVSLHTSTSGLDLPMKVVDFFGSGLPVCAVSFQCIGELVIQDKNGVLFGDAAELSAELESLLHGFPSNPKLAALRQGAQATLRWNENWEQAALPVIRASLEDAPRRIRLLQALAGLVMAVLSLLLAFGFG